ncbi:hypothetical protein CY35_10G029000 [Sphagnum magellanicum]|nr:hypothetical protein CY35_10G029000 [Sphagnum magellanicum]
MYTLMLVGLYPESSLSLDQCSGLSNRTHPYILGSFLNMQVNFRFWLYKQFTACFLVPFFTEGSKFRSNSLHFNDSTSSPLVQSMSYKTPHFLSQFLECVLKSKMGF